MNSWLRGKIEQAQSEGATHFYAHDLYEGRDDRPAGYVPSLFMAKKIDDTWYYRPLEVFGTKKEFSWFQNLDGAEGNLERIEVGLERLAKHEREREAKQTGQYPMF
ncbi:MAG: hypothetical protein ACXABN_18185 [Candidatus Thorarchaeota archaeon]|jgi:hypothetical protein